MNFIYTIYIWTIYLISFIANLIFFFLYEDLRPKGSDFFVSEICAARAAGINAKVKWGYRLVFLVLETEVSDIWSIPRNKRYGIYLAGLAWTSILTFICLLMQFYFLNEIVNKVLKFAVLMQLQTVVFQTLLFLRTDLYYVLANFLKIDDLNESMKFILKNLFTLNFKEIRNMLKGIPKREKKVIEIYSTLSFIGIVISLYLFFVIDLPIVFYSVKQTLEKTLNKQLFSIAYWDGIALGTLALCPIVILSIYAFTNVA